MDIEEINKIELLLDDKKEQPKQPTYLLTIDVSINDVSIAKKILGTLLEYQDYIEDVFEANLRKE